MAKLGASEHMVTRGFYRLRQRQKGRENYGGNPFGGKGRENYGGNPFGGKNMAGGCDGGKNMAGGCDGGKNMAGRKGRDKDGGNKRAGD